MDPSIYLHPCLEKYDLESIFGIFFPPKTDIHIEHKLQMNIKMYDNSWKTIDKTPT